jgi:hypothetical protein
MILNLANEILQRDIANVEGIFRISGNKQAMEKIKKEFDMGLSLLLSSFLVPILSFFPCQLR